MFYGLGSSYLARKAINICMTEYDLIIEALVADAPTDEITEILAEGKFDDDHKENQNFYLLMLEQYIDECSCYTFKGWEDIKFYGGPVIEKYWIEFKIITPDEFDYEGGMRRLLGKNREHKAAIKKIRDGGSMIKLRILRSTLDDLEEQNRKIARKEAEEQGFAPAEEAEDMSQDDMDDPFADDGMDDFGGDDF